MILVIVLLLFNPVTSKENKERCLREVKCSEVETPNCVRVMKRNHITHVVANQCELQRIKCSEEIDATVVSMKNCHNANGTQYLRNKKNKRTNTNRHEFLPNRVVMDTYARELGFMIDTSFNDTKRWDTVRKTVKEIAEEAVKYYDVTFFAFSTDGVGGFYTSDSFKDVTEFLDKFYYYSYTGTDYFFKPDFCHAEILSPIRKALSDTKWRPDISHLYVFTHNLAKDYDLFKTWKANSKPKVTIVLMPDCAANVRSKPEFHVYYEFTTSTQGQLFRTREVDDVPKFKEFVRHTALAFEPKVLVSKVINLRNHYIPIRVAESIAYVVVSVCGSDVNFAILDDWGNSVQPQFLMNRADSKVYRFVALPPHTYRVHLDPAWLTHYGNWNVSVNVVTSKVDFTFKYRLSDEQKWNGENGDASTKSKYVIVRVTDKRDLMDKINKIKFIELDENDKEEVFVSYKLREIADNVYATKHKVKLPTHAFFMVVSGTLKGTKKELDSREVKYTPSVNPETEEQPGPQLLAKLPTATTDTARWKQFQGSCPKQCPVRDVMVCARCEHGVQSTFMSDCHMRLYQCRYPADKLILVARRPCLPLGPYLGDMPRPAENVAEPNDDDPVLTHIFKPKILQAS